MKVICDLEKADKKAQKIKKFEKVVGFLMKIIKSVFLPCFISMIIVFFFSESINFNIFKVLIGVFGVTLSIILLCGFVILIFILCVVYFENDCNTDYYLITKGKKVLDIEVLFSTGDDVYTTNYSMSEFDTIEVFVVCEDENNTITKEKLHKNFNCVFKNNTNEMIFDLIEGVIYYPYKNTKENI